MDLKKTPLYDEHIKQGARMVDFAGWNMPVQFTSLSNEHKTVREAVGLFDVSHMGEVFVRGPKALETMQWLTSNDVSKLTKGKAQYSLLLNPNGGVVDDIIVYCLEEGTDYLVCVNASNIEKDFNWMVQNNKGAEITNESPHWAQVAIQGPKAETLVSSVLGGYVKNIKYFGFVTQEGPSGAWHVARTGYTGEDGFEVFLPATDAPKLWQDLMAQGEGVGVAPIGLGARDSLRTEMKYPLYGHEITDDTNALEAGLGWVVKMAKGDFIGRAALEASKPNLKHKLVGIKLTERGVPRQGYPLISFDNKEIGKVTSGTMSPITNEAIGVAMVDKAWAEIGTELLVQIRSRNVKAVVVKTPFIEPKKS